MLTSHDLDETQQLLQASVTALGRAAGDDSGSLRFTEGWWQELGRLGVLALTTDDGGGTASDLAAAHEALGRLAAPGPLCAVPLASHVADPGLRGAVHSGELLVGLKVGAFVAWAPPARFYLEVAEGRAWWCETGPDLERVDTMALETWSRGEAATRKTVGQHALAVSLSLLAGAAYLVGAGLYLLEASTEHAKSRRQFGRAIGDFQAVAHPLALCEAKLMTARQLLYLTAHDFMVAPPTDSKSTNGRSPELSQSAVVAFTVAERASLDMSFTAHQVHGAMGFGAEAPIGRYSARIRQVSLICAGLAQYKRAEEGRSA